MSKKNAEYIILNTLDKSDCYGYEIMKAVSGDSAEGAGLKIKQPTLYNYLKRMHSDGLIEYYWGEESNGGRRKYYKISPQGKIRLQNYLSGTPDGDGRDISAASLAIPKPDNDLSPSRETALPRRRFATSINEQRNIQMQLDGLLNQKNQQGELMNTDNSNAAPVYKNHETDAGQPHANIAPTDINQNQTEHASQDETASDIGNVQNSAKPEPLYIEQNDSSALPYAQPLMQSGFQTSEDFYAKFEEKIQARVKQKEKAAEVDREKEDNYKHIINNLIGDQLKDESLYTSRKKSDVDLDRFADPNLSALENAAEKFAEKGIRLNFYNKETSSYKPQPMLYKNKINFAASWLTYLTAAFEILVLWLLSMKVLPISVPAGYWLSFLAVPLAFTVIYLINPTRKRKPDFKFSYHFINAWIAFALLAILIFVVNVLLLRIVFTDAALVLGQIVMPLLVALALPSSVFYYNLIYKKMLV